MRPDHRPEIQGLRGVAVLLVVLYHARVPSFAGGFIGVDVFFVISGYLITGLIVNELAATGTLRLVHFWARRAKRLLPAAWLLIVIVLAATAWVYPPMEQADIFSSARAASVYLVNFWFTFRAVDYLGDGASANPMLHMWSLAVEEQFYVVWPLLLLAAACGAPRERLRTRLVAIVAGISIASLIACVWLTWKSQPWAFFGMPFRAWEFGIGAIVALLRDRAQHSSSSGLSRHAGTLGAGMILAGVAVLDESSLFPGAWALLPAGALLS